MEYSSLNTLFDVRSSVRSVKQSCLKSNMKNKIFILISSLKSTCVFGGEKVATKTEVSLCVFELCHRNLRERRISDGLANRPFH